MPRPEGFFLSCQDLDGGFAAHNPSFATKKNVWHPGYIFLAKVYNFFINFKASWLDVFMTRLTEGLTVNAMETP